MSTTKKVICKSINLICVTCICPSLKFRNSTQGKPTAKSFIKIDRTRQVHNLACSNAC